MSSPVKLLSPELKYSPISVSLSPVVKIQGNLTGSVRHIRDIAADLFNHTQKWNESFLNGISLIQDIIDLKLSSLLSPNNILKENLYPKGIEKMCEKFDTIENNLVCTVNSMKSSIECLCGIRKFEESKGNASSPLFLTWPISKFEAEGKIILQAYANELKLKQYVKRNIAHSHSKETLLSYLPLWVQQCYINNDINFRVEAMLKECGHRS